MNLNSMSSEKKFNNDKKEKIVIHKMRKQLEKDIHKLTKNEYNEIFNIIRNNGSKYSENSRGVYINLNYIDKDTLTKMINFIEYSKNNKKNNKNVKNKEKNSNNSSTINNREKNKKLDRESIHKELQRLKEKQSQKDHFSFQNFLDKLSVTNIKQFNNNDKIKYPVLKTSNIKFNGVKARLLKKCRETNKISNLNYNFNKNNDNYNNDYASNDEISVSEKDIISKKDCSNKTNINNIIKNNTDLNDNFDIENYYNESINF
tara:strand:+ start:2485 stop:3264 length:780 start_codon:yes stop_codon:yes gene_type:complete